MFFYPALLFGIFLIALVLTMVGLGGGLLFSPLFALLGFEKSMVVSTSLFLNLAGASSAASIYLRRGMVDYPVALPLLAGGLTAPLGAMANQHIDTKSFTLILAIVVLFGALRMLFSPKGQVQEQQGSKVKKAVGSGMIGLAIGFMSGLLGIGGGVFILPLLIYVLKVPTKTAAASNTLIVCFSSLTGFVTHAAMSSINWSFILLAALFSFAGGQIGSRLMAERLQGRTVRLIFVGVLFFMSVRLIYKTLF